MYEGGSHFVGNVYLSGYGGINLLGDRFTDFNINVSHSAQMARVYRAMYEAFDKIGGKLASLYTLDGPP
jgi:hypothetical protein